MLEFILDNLSTIVVGGLVIILVSAVAVKMLRDKKKGKGSCGCACTNCPSAGMCHTK